MSSSRASDRPRSAARAPARSPFAPCGRFAQWPRVPGFRSPRPRASASRAQQCTRTQRQQLRASSACLYPPSGARTRARSHAHGAARLSSALLRHSARAAIRARALSRTRTTRTASLTRSTGRSTSCPRLSSPPSGSSSRRRPRTRGRSPQSFTTSRARRRQSTDGLPTSAALRATGRGGTRVSLLADRNLPSWPVPVAAAPVSRNASAAAAGGGGGSQLNSLRTM